MNQYELIERLKRLEDILLRGNESCKAEPVNPVRWRAERGGYYFVVTSQLKATSVIENYGTLNNEHFEQGNYYREIEQAEEMSVLMQFTLNNPELVKQLMDKKE